MFSSGFSGLPCSSLSSPRCLKGVVKGKKRECTVVQTTLLDYLPIPVYRVGEASACCPHGAPGCHHATVQVVRLECPLVFGLHANICKRGDRKSEGITKVFQVCSNQVAADHDLNPTGFNFQIVISIYFIWWFLFSETEPFCFSYLPPTFSFLSFSLCLTLHISSFFNGV